MPGTVMRTAVLGLSLLADAGWAGAQQAPPSQEPVFVLLIDLRAADNSGVVVVADGAPLGFPVSDIDKTTVHCKSRPLPAVTRDTLKGYLECAIGRRLSGAPFAPTDVPTIDEQAQAATAISQNLAPLRKASAMRAISDRGSVVLAVTIQSASLRTVTRCEQPEAMTQQLVTGRTPSFKVTETARKSRIQSDFDTLLTLAAAIEGARGTSLTRGCAYEETTNPTVWALAKPIPLAVKRATVGVDAFLPAVAPGVIAATSEESQTVIDGWMKEAAAATRVKGLQEAESTSLERLEACPPSDTGRFDPLQLIACDLEKGSRESTPTVVSAVQALVKSPASEKTVLLRWVVEHKTGRARELALVALAQAPAPASAKDAAAGKEVKQSVQFLSGPLEHWSISADVFTTRETLFKKDEDVVVLDGTPPVFYVSLNFLFGDQASDKRSLIQNIELKWLMKGSDSPFDSLGFGVGLRGKYAKRFGLDFDLLSPFVAWTWTELEDTAAPRLRQFRFGVSLSLNEALNWVKK